MTLSVTTEGLALRTALTMGVSRRFSFFAGAASSPRACGALAAEIAAARTKATRANDSLFILMSSFRQPGRLVRMMMHERGSVPEDRSRVAPHSQGGPLALRPRLTASLPFSCDDREPLA